MRLNKKQISRKFLKKYREYMFLKMIHKQSKYCFEDVLKQIHRDDSPNSFQEDWSNFVESVHCKSFVGEIAMIDVPKENIDKIFGATVKEERNEK